MSKILSITNMFRHLKIILLLFMANAISAEVIPIDETFTKLNTSSHVYLFKDYSQSLQVTDFLSENESYPFVKNTSNTIENKRQPGSNIWLKLSLQNITDKIIDLRLVARSDALHYALFETEASMLLKEFNSGMNIAATNKPLQHTSVAFPIHLPANANRTVYIRSNSDHIATEIFYLESIDFYDRSNINSGLRLGGVISLLFLAALISILLFVITKSKVNLYYCLYATSNAISFFIATRIPQFSLIPDISTGHIPQFVGILITSIFFLKFIQEFYSTQVTLNCKRTIFTIYTTMMVLFIPLILSHSFLASHFNIHPFWERLPMIILAIMCLYAYYLIIKFAIKRPNRNNILFLLAFSGILISSMISVVLRNGLIQQNFLVNNLYEISLILEFILLSIILVRDLANSYSQRIELKAELLIQEKEASQAKILRIAVEEKDTLLREIHHRVKNNLQVISALLTLQSKHVKDEVAFEALQEGQGRVQSMALIHQDLYQHDNLKGVNTQDYFEKLIDNLIHTYKTDDRNIELECDITPLLLDVDTMIPLGLIVNELTSNSLKHAFQDQHKGSIKITLKEINEQLRLSVKDNGQGTDEMVLENKSFGFSLIKSFARRLDAKINIENENGLGVELLINHYQKAV